MPKARVNQAAGTAGLLWTLAFWVFGPGAATAARDAPINVLRVPVVAIDSQGAAVAVLRRDALEVHVNGRRTEAFSLEKRPSGSPSTGQRIDFLIFDTLSTTHLWLSKAKIITERVLRSADPGISYLLLSFEPGSGLRYILGPSQDGAEVLRVLRREVVARQAGSGLDSGPRRISRDDNLLVGDPRTEQPRMGTALTERDPISGPKTKLDELKKGAVFLASLGTLNTALSGFHDSVKSVYFFSGGIPSRTQYQDRSTTDFNLRGEVQTIDSLFLNNLTALADSLRAKGAVVFVINPSGPQVGKDDPGSGVIQLQLLAERAGGCYIEGEPEAIVRRLTEMESAFHELVLPVGNFGTDPIDIEIKSKDPGLKLHYAHRIFPTTGFDGLSREEKMRLALDAAEGGNASRLALRLQPAEVISKSENPDGVLYRLRLPKEFLDSPLDVFRIWLGRDGTPSLIDLQRLVPEGGELSLSVEKKKGRRLRVLVVEPRSAAGLIVP
jgi:hypothetical protein